MFGSFEDIVTNILNGSGTWIKSRKAFLYSKQMEIHFPFKHSFEEFKFHNLEPDYELTIQQRLIILKAFLSISNIEPKFLTEDLKKELSLIDLTQFAPNKNLENIITIKKEIKEITIPDQGIKAINRGLKVIKKNKFSDFLFDSNLKISIGERVGLKEYEKIENKINIDNNVSWNSQTNDKPFFSLKFNSNKKHEKTKIDSLVLWDIENVNFYEDFSKITQKIKSENQLKIISFFRKNKSDKHTFYWGDLDFKLRKLKKRDWIIKTSKESADTELIDTYYKYKNEIKELILITGDSDFEDIVKDAIAANINVRILNNSNRKKNWFDKYNFESL